MVRQPHVELRSSSSDGSSSSIGSENEKVSASGAVSFEHIASPVVARLAGVQGSRPSIACRPGRRGGIATSARKENPSGDQRQTENFFDCFGVEAVRKAFQAFEIAAGSNDRQGEASCMSRKLALSQECRSLIDSGQQLVQSVAAVFHGNGKFLCRLPKMMVRKALEVCCAVHLPELRELKRLKHRIDEFQQQQLVSSRAYLDELVLWRSHVRTSEVAALTFESSDFYFWDPLKALPDEIQALAIDAIIEKLRSFASQGQAKTLEELQVRMRQMQHRNSELELAEERLNLELVDSRAAISELETRLELQVAKLEDMEKNGVEMEFNSQRCKQIEISWRAEQRHCKELNSELEEVRKLLSGSHAARLDRELCECKRQISTLENRLRAAESVSTARDFRSFALPDVERISTEEILGKQLKAFGEEVSYVSRETRFADWMCTVAEKVSKEFQALRQSLEAEAEIRVQTERKLTEALDELDDLGIDRSNDSGSPGELALDDNGLPTAQEDILLDDGQVPQKRFLLPDGFGISSRRNSLASSRRNSFAAENALMLGNSRRASDASDFSSALEFGSRKEMRAQLRHLYQRREMEEQELEAAQEALVQKEKELDHLRSCALNAESLASDVKSLKDELLKTKAELSEALESYLHPVTFARLKIELRNAKHECVVAHNANAALQSSLAYAQWKLAHELGSPRKDPILEDIGFITKTMDHDVYNRLYGDAMRRHYQFASMVDESSVPRLDDKQDEEADVRTLMQRSYSAPSRVLLSGDVRSMFKMNALDLMNMRSEPVFSQPLNLPADKGKKRHPRQPIPLVAFSPEPVLSDESNPISPFGSCFEDAQRVGSLVVWHSSTATISQSSSTTAPSAQSCLASIVRPDSAQRASPGKSEGSTSCSVRTPRIIRELPSKIAAKDMGLHGKKPVQSIDLACGVQPDVRSSRRKKPCPESGHQSGTLSPGKLAAMEPRSWSHSLSEDAKTPLHTGATKRLANVGKRTAGAEGKVSMGKA